MLYSILQYRLFFGGVRPLESRCVLLALPSTIPLVTTILYRMVLDLKYHRIYGTIESMTPAQLCRVVTKIESINQHRFFETEDLRAFILDDTSARMVLGMVIRSVQVHIEIIEEEQRCTKSALTLTTA